MITQEKKPSMPVAPPSAARRAFIPAATATRLSPPPLAPLSGAVATVLPALRARTVVFHAGLLLAAALAGAVTAPAAAQSAQSAHPAGDAMAALPEGADGNQPAGRNARDIPVARPLKVELVPASVMALAARYPDGAIASVPAADQALREVSLERAGVADRFSQAEQVCYEKFFAARCLDGALETRRESLAVLRKVEVQADAFKRREKADKRDRTLEKQRVAEMEDAPRLAEEEKAAIAASEKKAAARAARLEKSETTAAKRAVRASAGQEERAASGAAPALRGDSSLGSAPQNAATPSDPDAIARSAAADAEKRARNVKAFEEKAAKAQERQRQVAQRKAEKEQARIARQARLKAEADARAAKIEAAKAAATR